MFRSTALGLAAMLALAGSAAAQQQPPPARAQGRPDRMTASPLAPLPPRLTTTPAERIPLDRIRVPAGFEVEVWASGMPGARMMALSPNGTLFVGTRTIGRVYAVTQKDGQRTHRVIAQGLRQPNGVAFRDGSLFVIAINEVRRYDGIEQKLDNPGEPVNLTAAFNLPTEEHHGWKFAAFGPDGKLYMQVGAPCNICRIDENRHALILRYNPDGSGREIMARGVRNSVGFDWQPGTNLLWFTSNGRDWAGDDTPSDILGVVRRPGEHFGFPYCHAGDFQDPDVKGRQCSEFSAPVLRLGPHVAALGMRFYTGAMFPAEYRGNIFIARHGSWNRTEKTGFDVVRVAFDANGTPKMEPFMTGLLQGNEYYGRPTDVQMLPDGSLLVSDEQNGAIYRISH